MGSITVLAFLLRLDDLTAKVGDHSIGIDVAAALGGLPSLTGAIIILTGIAGLRMYPYIYLADDGLLTHFMV